MECPPVLSSCSLFLALKHPDDCSEKAQLKSSQQDFTSITVSFIYRLWWHLRVDHIFDAPDKKLSKEEFTAHEIMK